MDATGVILSPVYQVLKIFQCLVSRENYSNHPWPLNILGCDERQKGKENNPTEKIFLRF